MKKRGVGRRTGLRGRALLVLMMMMEVFRSRGRARRRGGEALEILGVDGRSASNATRREAAGARRWACRWASRVYSLRSSRNQTKPEDAKQQMQCGRMLCCEAFAWVPSRGW